MRLVATQHFTKRTNAAAPAAPSKAPPPRGAAQHTQWQAWGSTSLLVAKAAHPRLIIGPAGAHLDPQLDKHFGVQRFFQLDASFGADALDALALVANHHRLVAVALDHDGSGDFEQALLLATTGFFLELVDYHGGGI